MLDKFGWHKDEIDRRDHPFLPELHGASILPQKIDLSTTPYELQPVFDQRPLSSCSAHAISAMFHFVNAKEGRPPVLPSRLFVYYNERKLENTIPTDSGAQIRDGIKTIAANGVCDETDWPYDVAKFAQAPPDACYANAQAHRTIEYFSIAGKLASLKSCLAAGYPFVFGMSVCSNCTAPEFAQTGIGTMPGPNDTLLGGHAVMAAGYDDSAQTFLLRNSVGSAWGMKGYFTLPYAFLESRHLTDNFWTIRRI